MTNNNRKKPLFRIIPLERKVLLSATCLEPEVTEFNNPDFHAPSVHEEPTDLNQSLTEYSSGNLSPIHSNYCFELIKTWQFDKSEPSNSEEEKENAVHDQTEHGQRMATSSPPFATNWEFDPIHTIGVHELNTASDDVGTSGSSSQQRFELSFTDHPAFENWSPQPEEHTYFLFPAYPPALDPVGLSILDSCSQSIGADIATSHISVGLTTLSGNGLIDSQRDTIEAEFIVSPSFQAEWQDPASTLLVAHTNDGSAGSLRNQILEANALAGYEKIRFADTDGDILIIDDLPSITGFHNYPTENVSGVNLIGTVESINATAFETFAKSIARDVILVDRQLNDSETLIASAQFGSIVFSYDGTSESAATILGRVSGWASEYATNIRSLSILSHGTTGAFELGNQWITSDTLDATAEQWRDIANYFIEDANIYILGCNIGTSGQTLLDNLAVITSADVYASDDITGVGGDWILELASTDAVTLDIQALESVFDIKELQSAEVSLAWYNANWSYRQSVTVSSSLLDGSVDAANFSVLVDITQTSLRSTGNGGNVGQTDGGDFVFTSSDGATKLNHEIESYDAVTGRLKAWVQVPTLSALSNTSLYVYYGNAGAANQWNNSGTWDATYGGVWHLSNSSFTDSTSNANNGTNVSTTDVTGIIEEGRTFNGSSQLISVADSNSLDESNTFTISAWIRPTVNDSNWRTIVNKGPDNAGGNYWFGIRQSQLEVYIAGTGYDSNFTVPVNTWSHVAATFNNSTDTLVIYSNGTVVYTNTSATATPGTNTDPLYIGRSALNNEWWQGSLDEVRFQRSIESENEIRADYRVQNSPGTYVTLASEEGAPVITSNGGGTSASINSGENQTSVTTVTATDPGTPLQTLTYSISGGVDAARFTINSSSGVLTFVTPPNFESPTDTGSNNVYDVIVQVSDGTLTDTQSIAVTITNVNEVPTAVVDAATAVEAGGLNNGTAGTNPSGNVLTNDTDVDASDTKTVNGVAAGVVGSASTNVGSAVTGSFGSINIAANGTYTYTVNNTNASVQALRTTANTLSDIFTYTMRDTAGLTSTTQITITIQGANDAPVAVSDAATAVEAGGQANGTAGTDPTGNVLTNDTDVDSVGNGETKAVSGVLAGVQVSASGNVGSNVVGAYGSINIAANGTYTYTVDNTNATVQALRTIANTLQDVFTYTLTDANGLTATTQITVTIQGANDAPTIGTEFTGLITGNYTFVSGGQTFVAYVTQYAGSNWVLIGRGREGWEFDTDGQGLATEVSQNLGTVNAFTPKAYSDTIINDMLARAGTNMTNVELRIMRATTTNGSGEYQEIRWGNFSGNSNNFTWNIEDSSYSMTQTQVNAPAALPGAQIGSSSTNTNDSINFGNDGDRIFTWAWSSHNNSKGFSYGQSVVGTDGNSATSYLWEFSTEDHAIPYTEVYMRLVNPNLAALTYAENDVPRAVIPTIVLGDIDQSTLPSATVQITGNFAAGQDVLGFTNTANITGSYNASTGVLTLTGTDTLAAYTAALRTVTYSNTSDSPSTLTRTVSFTINDSSLNSTSITRDITITAANDAPIAIADTATAVEAGGVANGTTGTNPTGNVLTNDTDPDSGDTKTVTGVAAGVVGSASTNVGSAVSGTFGSITIAANGTYTYTVDNANTAVQALRSSSDALTDVFTYTMRDTVGSTSTTQLTVTIQGANDAPHDLAATGLTVAENAVNTTAVGTITRSDLDSSDTATYSLVDNAGGRFAINSSTGAITVANSTLLNFEAATSHSITVRVTDTAGATYDEAFTITLTDVDEFDVGTVTDTNATANSIAENSTNGTVVGITAAASDGDGSNNTITYSLDDSAGGRFAIANGTGIVTLANSTLLNFEAATSHNITVRATSSDGSFSTQVFSISLTDVDEFDVGPVTDTNATANSIAENSTNGTVVGITAAASDGDGSNNTITYSLDDNAGGRFAIASGTGVVTVANSTLLNFEAATSHNITVRATSSDGSFSTQVFSISLTDVDEFDVGPVTDTNATANSIAENSTNGTVVGITASASDGDSSNNTITYSLDDNAGGRFAIASGTGIVTVANSTLLNFETATSHNITVRATSSDGSFSTQVFSVSLTDVDEFDVGPVTDTNASANSIAENSTNGTVVGITAAASDGDGSNNTITYSLDDNAGGRFAIASGTGVVTVANSTLLNFEAATSHNITVRATSSDGSFSTQVFSVSLTDVDEFDVGPVTDTNASANSIAENSTNGTVVGITAAASDGDGSNNSITYSLDDSAGGRFAIASGTGIVTVANSTLLNFEAATSHNITVRATSSDGSFSTQVFSVSLTDVDEFDVGPVTDTNATTNSIAENSTNGTIVGITASASDGDGSNNTITYSLDDNAGGRFAIASGTGVVTVANSTLLNFEAATSHNITVRATSSDGSFSTQVFSVSLTDVDEFDVGPVTDTNATANSIAENSTNGTVVGITAAASDGDGSNNTITYSLDDNAGGRFAISGSTGIVTVANSTLLNFEAATSHNITVRATSSDGSFSAQVFSVSLTDVDEFDVGPVTDTNATANSISENSTNGTVVGITASASDGDGSNNTITYSLDDNAGGRFAIAGGTGIVTVANSTLLNFEAATSHNITVRATSSDGSFSTQVFSVSLTDVDEFDVGPVTDTNASANSIAENSTNGTVVGITASASDGDGSNNTITYSLDDNAGGRFAIASGTGIVTVANSTLLNFEAATSHNITVRATSSDGSFSTQVFSVSLTDVDEFDVGPVTDTNATANSIAENSTNGTVVGITAAASDGDGSNNNITYSLDDNAGGRFAIASGTGIVTVANSTLLNFEAATSHNITVRATSSDGSFSTQVFTISLTDVDEFDVGPVTDTNASANSIAENSTNGTVVGITASASDGDGSNNTITYSLDDNAGGRFAIASGTGIVTVANSTLLNFEAATSHNITVRATSSDGSFSTQVFSVSLTDVDEFDVGPVTDTNASANSIAENSTNGTVVGITASASDGDGSNNTITYSLDDNAGGRFAIAGGTGIVTVANSTLLNFETATSHNITVRATSSDGSFSTQVFSISLTDVDEFDVGPITDTNASANSIAENSTNGTVVGITASASDGDGSNNTITYSLDDNAGGRFAIASGTGIVTVANSTLLNFEAATSHNITVRATSSDGSFSAQVFSVSLTDVDEFDVGPVTDTNASANSIAENSTNGTLVGITVSASDADGSNNMITYSLHDNDGGRFAIDSVTGVVTLAGSIDREADGPTRDITVRAISSDGSFTDQTFSITVDDVDEFNVGPVIDTNATTNNVNENASIGTVIQITALAADADATTNTITYSLQDNDGGRFAIDSVTGIVTVAGAIDREADGSSRNITVRATSSDGSFTDQAFSIAINDIDEFNVGAVSDSNATTNNVNENASIGSVVQITAVAADADATTNTITYSLQDNDGGRFAIDSVTGIVTVASAIDREADGSSRNITVRATSSDGSFTDQVFTVAINDIDEFNVGAVTDTNATTNNVNENASIGSVVQITALAADADATTNNITYSLQDNDGGRFAIDSVTGIVTVAGAIDREADGPTRNITVRATSSDGSFTDQAFSIAINDIDEFNVGPVSDSNATTNNVNENASIGSVVQITAVAADADATTNTITYSLQDDDGGRFAIDSVTGIVTVAGAIDREADGPTRNITVRATSSDGSFTDQAFSIAINDIDEFNVGPVSDSNATTNNVNENASIGSVVQITAVAADADATTNTITYSLQDDDGGRFTIDSVSGVVTVAGAIDREADGPTRNITVRATSSDGSFTDQAFSIATNDIDEFNVGAVTDTNATTNNVNENASIGTIVQITAVAADADATTNTITYSLQDDDGGRFTIDSVTGIVTVASAIDREADGPSRNITVRATSSDGSFTDQAFSIAINDIDEFNVGTVSDTNATTNNVNENASIGTVVQITALATDADATTNTITYSLQDNDGGRFTIDSVTGIVTVAGAIDREADGSSRNITVRATSSDGSFTDQAFSIAINDIDEFNVGAVTDTNATTNNVNENASIGTVVQITAVADDADATTNTITYSLQDDDGGRFTIDSVTGIITVAGAIDRETDGPSRNITVRATSSDGSFTDQAFTVAINDVDEFNVGPVTDSNATTNNVNENASIGTVVQITAVAADADATTNSITYSLQDNDGGRFAIDTITGVVTVAGTIDREADGPSRNITVRATSSDGSFTDQAFSIAINDIDEFNVGAVSDSNATTNNVNENASIGTLVQITALATDADATTNTITYSLQDNDGGRFAIDSVTGIVTVAGAIDREADGPTRNITVRATSSDGSFTDQAFSIAINDVDEFNVGPVTDSNATTNNVNENASIGTVVQITAVADDADATTNTITYSLQDDDGGRFTIDSVTGIITVAGAIDRETDGPSRNITVRATSSDGSFTDQAFTVAINDVDEFNVGPVTDSNATTNNVNENASIGTVVQITAVAADADATTNSITYSLQDNDGGRFTIDSVTGVVTVAGAIDREADGPTRNITVRATSSDGSFTDQAFSIAINDIDEFNVGPVSDSNATTNNVNENASIGTVIQITALAADADATTNSITYSLQDNDGGRFTIDSVSGVVTVAGTIDREADGSSRNITVRATSSDGSFTDQAFSIAINDIDEFNVGTVSDSNATTNNVNENASIGTVVQITAVASDADATTNTITYSLQDNDGGRFAIDSVTGIVTVAGTIDREADGPSRNITVRATSSDGSFTDQVFTVAINDIDEFNVGAVTDTNATTNNVNENASIGTVVQITALTTDADATTNTITYSLQDDDGGRFTIDSVTGIVTVAGAIDREADGSSRNITVRATSSDGSFTDQAFSIAINDIDEFNVGTVSDSNATTNNVNENASIGTVVQITALATDADATTNTITYSLQDNDGGRFTIDSVTGIVTVAGAIDREADGPSRNITVRATSSDGSFTDQAFTVAINDVDEFNVGPVSDSNATSNNVNENASAGTVVQITALAADADATTNNITYSLQDNDGGRFTIDSVTGIVTVAGAIDREADGPSRNITVRATSSDGSFTDQVFTVAINDIDEFNVGAVSDSNATTNNVNENASVGTVIQITALAADPDATTNVITYSLQDDDGGRFAIDSVTGIVTVAGAIDREADGPTRNITVRATSSDGSFTDQVFTVAINDIDEFNVGTVTDTNATTNNVNENASIGSVVQITALAADADATTNTITYSLQDNDGGRFAIDSVTGIVTVAGAIDREADGPSRNITVRATSSDGSFTDQAFSIAINDIDEFNVGTVSDTNATTNNVNENASIGTVVQITALAADADATTNVITYSLQDDDGGRFAIDSVTGIVTVAGAIDREADGSSRNITVRATSSDGSFTDQAFSIAINDVDEFNVGPVSDSNATTNNVNENASIGSVVQIIALAADADATTNTITYSLQDDDGGRFTIDSVTGIVTVAGAIDREADGPSRNITVRATSSDGSFTDQVFTVAINDIDEFNVGAVTDTNATTNNVNENASIGSVVQITALAADADATTNNITYSLQDNDGGRFAIDSVTGIVTVAGAIDREADGPTRNITVRATSSDGSFTDQAFSIDINDIDEFNVGAITDTNATTNNVNENASIGTVAQITALATDADATTNTITYSLHDDDGGRFVIDSVTGIVTVAGAIDREAEGPSRNITVRATSSDGSFTDQILTISVSDIDEFDVGSLVDSNNMPNIVQEHSPNGTVVAVTILAQDLDATNNTVTYQLIDDALGRFDIDPNSGIVSVANSSLLRFELGPNYSVIVRADSIDGSFETAQFQITLDNVNDAPFAVNDTLSLSENGLQSLDVLANDFDLDPGDSLQIVSVSMINGLGQVTFNNNYISFDPGTNYDYLSTGETATVELNYTITDANGLQDAADVTLIIYGNRDALILNAPDTSFAEDTESPWNISVTPIDLNGETLTSVIVFGLPEGTMIKDDQGRQILVVPSIPTQLIAFDLDHLEIALPQHVSGDFVITVQTESSLGTISTQSIARLFEVESVADSPLLVAEPVRGQLGDAIPITLNAELIDNDGSERLTIEVRGLPIGMILTDGNHQLTISNSQSWLDISDWNLAQVVLRTAGGLNGSYFVELRATAIESTNQDLSSTSEMILVVIDEVLPVLESTEFDEIFDTNTSDPIETKSQDKSVVYHSAHDHGHNSINDICFNTPIDEERRADLSIPTDDSPAPIRQDSPTASPPVPSFMRMRPLASDLLALDATQGVRNSSEALSGDMPQASLREIDSANSLYADKEPIGFLGSMNNTLLLAWTMVRSSVANFLSQNDGSGIEERKVPALNSKNEERVEKNKPPHKK
jgi:protocadherin Fat 4